MNRRNIVLAVILACIAGSIAYTQRTPPKAEQNPLPPVGQRDIASSSDGRNCAVRTEITADNTRTSFITLAGDGRTTLLRRTANRLSPVVWNASGSSVLWCETASGWYNEHIATFSLKDRKTTDMEIKLPPEMSDGIITLFKPVAWDSEKGRALLEIGLGSLDQPIRVKHWYAWISTSDGSMQKIVEVEKSTTYAPPHWDGRTLYYLDGGRIQRHTAGKASVYTNLTDVTEFAISNDKRILAVRKEANEYSLQLASAPTGPWKTLLHARYIGKPSFSPEGDPLAVYSTDKVHMVLALITTPNEPQKLIDDNTDPVPYTIGGDARHTTIWTSCCNRLKCITTSAGHTTGKRQFDIH